MTVVGDATVLTASKPLALRPAQFVEVIEDVRSYTAEPR